MLSSHFYFQIVENSVCTLRNLSYRLEMEMPSSRLLGNQELDTLLGFSSPAKELDYLCWGKRRRGRKRGGWPDSKVRLRPFTGILLKHEKMFMCFKSTKNIQDVYKSSYLLSNLRTQKLVWWSQGTLQFIPGAVKNVPWSVCWGQSADKSLKSYWMVFYFFQNI